MSATYLLGLLTGVLQKNWFGGIALEDKFRVMRFTELNN